MTDDDTWVEALTASREAHDTMETALRDLRTEINDAQRHLVELRKRRAEGIETARAMGWTWKRIGDALGVPRNAVPQFLTWGRGRDE